MSQTSMLIRRCTGIARGRIRNTMVYVEFDFGKNRISCVTSLTMILETAEVSVKIAGIDAGTI